MGSISDVSTGRTGDCAGTFSAAGGIIVWLAWREGTRGEGWVRGFESSINGSIEWMTSSIGRSLWLAMGLITGGIGTETWGTDDSGTIAAGSWAGRVAGDSTRVPQRLQNAESGGTRLPHREQNDPCGSDEVSTGFCGVCTVSMIFFMGRAISIFFFAVWPVAIADGAWETGWGTYSGSAAGVTALIGLSRCMDIFSRRSFTHSSHSRFLSPPT